MDSIEGFWAPHTRAGTGDAALRRQLHVLGLWGWGGNFVNTPTHPATGNGALQQQMHVLSLGLERGLCGDTCTSWEGEWGSAATHARPEASSWSGGFGSTHTRPGAAVRKDQNPRPLNDVACNVEVKRSEINTERNELELPEHESTGAGATVAKPKTPRPSTRCTVQVQSARPTTHERDKPGHESTGARFSVSPGRSLLSQERNQRQRQA